jgi:hypothetical protein
MLYTWKAPEDRNQHKVVYVLVKKWLRNSMKDVQTVPGADIDSNHNSLIAKISSRLKKIIRFKEIKPGWDVKKLHAQRQKLQGSLDCKGGNVEVQWNNTCNKKCVLVAMSDLDGKVERRTRKQWIIRKRSVKWMDKGSGRVSTTNKEGRTTEV